VGSTHRCFWFVGHVVESDLAIGKGIFVGHHPFQSKIYKINCVRNFDFHNKKYGGQNVQTTENKHQQIIS
jgi:hypothetical protein